MVSQIPRIKCPMRIYVLQRYTSHVVRYQIPIQFTYQINVLDENMKASYDQEKTRIEIPASRADEDEVSTTIMDTICGSGENRIMFRLSISFKYVNCHIVIILVFQNDEIMCLV